MKIGMLAETPTTKAVSSLPPKRRTPPIRPISGTGRAFSTRSCAAMATFSGLRYGDGGRLLQHWPDCSRARLLVGQQHVADTREGLGNASQRREICKRAGQVGRRALARRNGGGKADTGLGKAQIGFLARLDQHSLPRADPRWRGSNRPPQAGAAAVRPRMWRRRWQDPPHIRTGPACRVPQRPGRRHFRQRCVPTACRRSQSGCVSVSVV